MSETLFPAPEEYEALKDWLRESDEGLLVFDDLDGAVLGVVEIKGHERVVLYDRDRAIELLAEQGMSYEDAREFFDFNIADAFLGEKTPAFATLWRNCR